MQNQGGGMETGRCPSDCCLLPGVTASPCPQRGDGDPPLRGHLVRGVHGDGLPDTPNDLKLAKKPANPQKLKVKP